MENTKTKKGTSKAEQTKKGARAGFATTEVADESSQLAHTTRTTARARARLEATQAADETNQLASTGET